MLPNPSRLTVGYVRVSTIGQEEEGVGLDVQRNAIVAYAAANSLTLDAWHQDVESGAKADRPGLSALRAAAAIGTVGTLLVYRLDRLARDVLLAETVYREITGAGVRVVSVSEAMLDNSLTGNLLRMILAAFSQYERSLIALRTTSGRKTRVSQQGTHHGGTPPYGYRAVGNRREKGHGALVVDERQAAAVRLVFALSEQGRTLGEIAGELNRLGHRTGQGAGFTVTQVHRILGRADVYRAIVATTPSIPLADGVAPAHEPIIGRQP